MSILPAAIGSFLGGVATFFTPCVLPLVPVYIIYITGIGLAANPSSSSQALSLWRRFSAAILSPAFIHSVFFTLGFSAVFFILGLSATFLSDLIFANKNFIRIAGGMVLILAGFFVAGIIKPRFLLNDTRAAFFKREKPTGLAGSFLVGAAFASGWSPCVGPALVAILTLTASRESLKEGVVLLAMFSSGLALPFILAGFFVTELSVFISRVKKYLPLIEKIFGFMIALVGILLIAGLI